MLISLPHLSAENAQIILGDIKKTLHVYLHQMLSEQDPRDKQAVEDCISQINLLTVMAHVAADEPLKLSATGQQTMEALDATPASRKVTIQ